MVDAEDGWPGGLDAGGVFACGLAQFFGALGHVEDVVDDLEGEAGFFAEGAEAGDGVGLMGMSGGVCWAERRGKAVEASGDDAGGDEGSGFGAVNGFDEGGGGGVAFGFDVHDLAADHAGGELGFEVAYAADAGAYGQGDHAEDGYSGGGVGW